MAIVVKAGSCSVTKFRRLQRHLQTLFEKRDPPYAGADLANARRMVSLLWGFGLLLGLVFLTFAPPNRGGAVGWAAVGALLVLNVVIIRVLARRGIGFGALLGLSYLSLAQLVFVQWLTGGADSPFRELFLISIVLGAGVHPPRRAAPFLALAALAVTAPITYESGAAGEDIAAHLFLWLSMGLAVMVLMDFIRRQRIAFQREQHAAEDRARIDPLTGLLNRQSFDELLTAEIATSRLSGAPLSLIVVDVDDFKHVNDHYGHLVGDKCLRKLADEVRAATRDTDRCFRWGGDEFAILLPATDLEAAEILGRRLMEEVSIRQTRPDGVPFSATHGTAELLPDDEPGSLMERADRQLLARKGSSG